LKVFNHGELSILKYKDRFDELVEVCLTKTNKRLPSLLQVFKYDVEALKPYKLGKTYSMAFTFEAKNTKLTKEVDSSFDVDG
jgi:hypothetical protein